MVTKQEEGLDDKDFDLHVQDEVQIKEVSERMDKLKIEFLKRVSELRATGEAENNNEQDGMHDKAFKSNATAILNESLQNNENNFEDKSSSQSMKTIKSKPSVSSSNSYSKHNFNTNSKYQDDLTEPLTLYEAESNKIIFEAIANSKRISTLLKRIYFSSFIISLLSAIGIIIWFFFDIHSLNPADSIWTFSTDGILMVVHLSVLICLYVLFKYISTEIINRLSLLHFVIGVLMVYKIFDLIRIVFFSYYNYFIGKFLM